MDGEIGRGGQCRTRGNHHQLPGGVGERCVAGAGRDVEGKTFSIQCLLGFDGWMMVAVPEGRVCHEADLVLDVCGMGGVCHVGGG